METGVSMNGRWVLDESLWNGQILTDGQTYKVSVATESGSSLSDLLTVTIDTNATEPVYTNATLTLVED